MYDEAVYDAASVPVSTTGRLNWGRECNGCMCSPDQLAGWRVCDIGSACWGLSHCELDGTFVSTGAGLAGFTTLGKVVKKLQCECCGIGAEHAPSEASSPIDDVSRDCCRIHGMPQWQWTCPPATPLAVRCSSAPAYVCMYACTHVYIASVACCLL